MVYAHTAMGDDCNHNRATTISGTGPGATDGRLSRPVTPKQKSNLTQNLTPEQWKAVNAARAEAEQKSRPDVRLLTPQEMRRIHGRGYRNKYLAGTFPWQRSLRDANLCNGTSSRVSPTFKWLRPEGRG